ncbi:MAG: HNH endonuclease [Sulfobacillus benefaciens]|uniref:HNH endonuclease n=1 Tax=Sulfobacillus benefaciens TaxID=453960 RepID=A0A2T2XLR4_9FIRM|nr:MAG: HNH endonuclease [Sulfobacillus benefaciens]
MRRSYVLEAIKDFKNALYAEFNRAMEQNAPYVDIRSGDLHRNAGGYPGPNHRMPSCCAVMEREMKVHDQILKAPPRGRGASLTIRYMLPR